MYMKIITYVCQMRTILGRVLDHIFIWNFSLLKESSIHSKGKAFCLVIWMIHWIQQKYKKNVNCIFLQIYHIFMDFKKNQSCNFTDFFLQGKRPLRENAHGKIFLALFSTKGPCGKMQTGQICFWHSSPKTKPLRENAHMAFFCIFRQKRPLREDAHTAKGFFCLFVLARAQLESMTPKHDSKIWLQNMTPKHDSKNDLKI